MMFILLQLLRFVFLSLRALTNLIVFIDQNDASNDI